MFLFLSASSTNIWLRLRGVRNIRSGGLVRIELSKTSRLVATGLTSTVGAPIQGQGSPLLIETIFAMEKGAVAEFDSVAIGRGASVRVLENAQLQIGKGTYLSERCRVTCAREIKIGAGCAISWDVDIFDENGHTISSKSDQRPILIGNKVWIGARSMILSGAVIGDGCIVAAGAVVKGQFPAGCLIGGVPARILKENISWS